MTPTRILIGQILVTLSVVLLCLWGGTQWAAHELGYQPRLGEPWFSIGGAPIYKPWRLFQWWYAYDAYAPGVFDRAGLIAASGGILGAITAVIGSVLRARQQKFVTTYGSARWAAAKDVRESGLLDPSGVFLGQWNGRYLRHDGPEHVIAFAPTRSGKGVGLVVPTLLSWPGSAVIHDIKGENWGLTTRWRSSFSHCLLFDPTSLQSTRFNPLLEVRRGENEVRDAQNIADILVDPEGSLERRNHWDRTGHALLVGVILHVLYAEEEKTLASVARFLCDPSRTFKRTLNIMMTTNHLGTKTAPMAHPNVAEAAREVLNKAENELSSVISTAMSYLGLYRDPVIARATSASDWQIADLVSAERPCSLYLVVPPSDISRTKPLVRLILNQIGRRLTETLPVAGERRHQVLMMLDEFPALGRLDFFESALAFMAGYGIRAYLITQSLNQIEKAYGPNNSVLDNCHVRIAFAANDERTAKRISDALGTATEQRSQRNYAGHRLAPWLAHVMVSRQETSRPLLTPGEVMQLPADQEIVMVSGRPPIKAQKLKYYADQNFLERVGAVEPGAGRAVPPARGDDWSGQIKRPCQILIDRVAAAETAGPADAGGRGRFIPLGDPVTSPADHRVPSPVEEAAHGQPRSLATGELVRAADALDQADDDLLPSF